MIHTAGKQVLALSGGVGGAKLVAGLSQHLPPEQLAVVCNTGDDFVHLGLTVCPDLDTVMYTLAGRASADRGWGLEGETWVVMDSLRAIGGASWFRLGDRDLATHFHRSEQLRAGKTLSEVTAELCAAFGVRQRILPMSDDAVRTVVLASDDVSGERVPLAFQHYFVRERCRPRVTGFQFEGIENARPQKDVMDLLSLPSLFCVVICPSNPFISIDPIIGLPGVRDQLIACNVPVIAVSPIVGGKALKGPAGKMMEELGMPVSGAAVAQYYADIIDGFLLDEVDCTDASAIERCGVRAATANTVMRTTTDQQDVARAVLRLASDLNGELN